MSFKLIFVFCSCCFTVSEYHKQPAGTPALSFDKVSLDEKLNIYNDLCKPVPLYAHLQLQVNSLPTSNHPSACLLVFDHFDSYSSQCVLFCFQPLHASVSLLLTFQLTSDRAISHALRRFREVLRTDFKRAGRELVLAAPSRVVTPLKWQRNSVSSPKRPRSTSSRAGSQVVVLLSRCRGCGCCCCCCC